MTKEKRENLFEKHKKAGWKPFDTYKVKIRLHDIVGGIPKTKELIEKWVNAKNKTKTKEERAKIRDAHLELLNNVIDDTKESQGIGFHRTDEGELFIEGRQVKAMIREVGNVIKDNIYTGVIAKGAPVTQIPQLRARAAEKLFCAENIILLGRTEPDEILERPIHVITPEGPRDAIKVYEICFDVDLEFVLKRFVDKGKGVITEEAMLSILDYAQDIGLGADRSQGRGKFEVISVEEIDKATMPAK